MCLDKFEEALRDYESGLEISRNFSNTIAQKKDPENEEANRGIREAKVALKRSKRKDYYKILGINRYINSW